MSRGFGNSPPNVTSRLFSGCPFSDSKYCGFVGMLGNKNAKLPLRLSLSREKVGSFLFLGVYLQCLSE